MRALVHVLARLSGDGHVLPWEVAGAAESTEETALDSTEEMDLRLPKDDSLCS